MKKPRKKPLIPLSKLRMFTLAQVETMVGLSQANDVALGIVKALAEMERGRVDSDVARIRRRAQEIIGRHIAAKEANEVFFAFSKAGMGTFEAPREQWGSPKFHWTINYKQISTEAMTRMASAPKQAKTPAPITLIPASPANELTLAYPLRPGYIVKITLPRDVTREEMSQLRGVLDALV